jgi:hypothetical protein
MPESGRYVAFFPFLASSHCGHFTLIIKFRFALETQMTIQNQRLDPQTLETWKPFIKKNVIVNLSTQKPFVIRTAG